MVTWNSALRTPVSMMYYPKHTHTPAQVQAPNSVIIKFYLLTGAMALAPVSPRDSEVASILHGIYIFDIMQYGCL